MQTVAAVCNRRPFSGFSVALGLTLYELRDLAGLKLENADVSMIGGMLRNC